MTTAISTPQRKTKAATKKTTHSGSKNASAEKDDLNGYIAAAAYFKAESRGFEPGHELEDWLEAEVELMSIQQKH